NAAAMRTESPSSPSVSPLVQPFVLPLTIAYTAHTSALVMAIAPGTSSRVFSAPVCTAGSSLRPVMRTAIPIGRLTRKIQCQPAVPEQVAEAAGEQQEASEGEHVGVDDPGERRLREAEVVADRGQRDVHDGGVDDDHQVAHAEDDEGEPAGSGAEMCVHAGKD